MPELNVATAPKNGTFQMRINPDIKEQVERIYANCGMTLTDAINTFLQQSINVGPALPGYAKQQRSPASAGDCNADAGAEKGRGFCEVGG